MAKPHTQYTTPPLFSPATLRNPENCSGHAAVLKLSDPIRTEQRRANLRNVEDDVVVKFERTHRGWKGSLGVAPGWKLYLALVGLGSVSVLLASKIVAFLSILGQLTTR